MAETSDTINRARRRRRTVLASSGILTAGMSITGVAASAAGILVEGSYAALADAARRQAG
jgi:hypothetical protein